MAGIFAHDDHDKRWLESYLGKQRMLLIVTLLNEVWERKTMEKPNIEDLEE